MFSMILKGKPGLLEQINTAVQPLTVNGDFQIESVDLEYYDREVTVRLYSPWLDITFRIIMRFKTEVCCYLRVHSVNKTFFAKFLFPALNLNIPINDGIYLRKADLPEINDASDKYQAEFDHFLKKTGFINELNRQCVAINEKMPEFRNIFRSDNMEKTIGLYLEEGKRHGSSGNPEYLDIKI